jgi:hypothetical protein
MEASCGWVVAFKLDKRVENAAKVQDVLTKHGCAIKARLGLHETSKDYCANYGIIILQCCGACADIEALVGDLNGIEGVCAKSMCLD